MGKNIRQWDLILAQIEFAYICCTSQTAGSSPYEIVYGKIPLKPLDLVLFQTTHQFSGDAEERVKNIKKMHEEVRTKIVKQTEKYQKSANKH